MPPIIPINIFMENYSMKFFFIDTGFVIALEAKDDQNHGIALNFWRNLIASHPSFVTTSYVLDETVTFFNSRNKHPKAVEIGNCFMNSPSIKFIHVDEAVFYEGWQYFKRHDDKSYSLTDCISFTVMKKFKISKALTFDKHFIQAGFEKLP